MKRKILLFSSMVLLFAGHVCFAQAPSQVGGFVLGDDISRYADRVKMESALPIRYQNYLTEVEIKKTPGFKSGLIAFGNCDSPGRIVRIKLKYIDASKTFYNDLLKRFKATLGEPKEWRGDAFHVVIAWKWSFVDKNNNPVSMTLQHNTMDEETKQGNSIKIAWPEQINKERLCYEKKHSLQNRSGKKHKKAKDPVNWDLYIPR